MPDVEDTTQVDVNNSGNSDDDAGQETDTSSDDGEGSTQDNLGIDGSGGEVTGKLKGAEAQEFVDDLLDEYGLESPDELKEFMGGLAGLKGKIGDKDLDKILENSETLERYQQHWAKQEREKQKEGETPEETIARLEKENEELANTRIKESERRKQAQAAERAYEGFCDTIESTIAQDKSIPKEYRPFLSEFLGVENPVNEVDIEDRAAVRKIAKNGIKKFAAFEQAVIKRYRDGKIKVPEVTSSGESQTTVDKDKSDTGPKNLSEARKLAHASLRALLGKKS